jgi:hypothetical protein
MIDHEHLDGLKNDLGPCDFDEVVELSIAELREAVASCQASPARPEHFHAVKGLALNLGMTELAGRAASGERGLDAAAGEAVRASFETSCTALSEFLVGAPPRHG